MRVTSSVVALLLVGYALPWVHTAATVGFTNSAYDLAEWISIHPLVRADPLLLTPLLLRVPLAVVALHVSWSLEPKVSAVARGAIALLIAVAMLPPLEFFAGATGDPNYQQMFALAVCTFLLSGFGIAVGTRLPASRAAAVQVIALVVGVLSGVAGLARALPLLQSFALTSSVGAGVGVFALGALLGIWRVVQKARSRGENKQGDL